MDECNFERIGTPLLLYLYIFLLQLLYTKLLLPTLLEILFNYKYYITLFLSKFGTLLAIVSTIDLLLIYFFFNFVLGLLLKMKLKKIILSLEYYTKFVFSTPLNIFFYIVYIIVKTTNLLKNNYAFLSTPLQ